MLLPLFFLVTMLISLALLASLLVPWMKKKREDIGKATEED